MNALLEPLIKLPKNKRNLLIMCMLLITFVAVSYSCIPLIFYKPTLQCPTQFKGEFVDCTQQKACLQKNPKYYSKYSFISIPQEYQLFCNKKITETNTMTLMLVGHFIGALLNIPLAKTGNKLRNVLILFAISSAIIGGVLIALLISTGTAMIGVILMIWTLVKQPIICFVGAVPGLAFPQHKQKAVGLIWSSWSIFSIFLPEVFWIVKNWRVILAVFVGVPHLIIAYIFYSNLDQFSRQQQLAVVDPFNDNSQQTEDGSLNWSKLISSMYLTNFIMFIIFYGGSYICVTTTTLYLNTVSWNLYIYLSVTSIIQVVACILGMFVGDNFDKGRIIVFIYSLLSLIFCVYTFCGPSFQSAIIMFSKILGDCLWVLLSQLLYNVVPLQLVPLLLASKNCYSLLISSGMPYLKYGMESIGFSLFPAAGMINLLSILSFVFIEPLDTDKLEKDTMIQSD